MLSKIGAGVRMQCLTTEDTVQSDTTIRDLTKAERAICR